MSAAAGNTALAMAEHGSLEALISVAVNVFDTRDPVCVYMCLCTNIFVCVYQHGTVDAVISVAVNALANRDMTCVCV